ncbi:MULTISPECIES: YheT family hydrolase [unclassified Janthinobacterium]|uniref:YheT family hydrolase n=1 Tax=unclassified Janthinobacterium TaxID=2610881 RepID=UPI00034A9D63|nr:MULTISPECIES: alpha/beta fold hydrolase [unclassified Janthinobacterium]MEC5161570.1 putative alpha/beta-fold hydrolase [Janthinobacterium sp. CG_S6]
MRYTAPLWLPNGHLQTIYPAVCVGTPAPAYRRERWDAPDGDFVDVDFVDGQPGHPFVLLFHGLEGSSHSHYARALMAELATRGWSGAVPHFRGCSGHGNRAPRFYHSGDAGEIDWIVRRLRRRAAGRFYATGVSLGGNALLRWLGESQHAAGIVDAACAVSAPLDLAQGGRALARGVNRMYTRMFLNTLKPKCLAKLDQFPGLFCRQALLAANDLHAFDTVVTAPLHGYRSADDYWDRASAKHVLDDITVPTLVLNAQNDPFLPARYLPRHASRQVLLEYPRHGGHAGFTAGRPPGHLDWLPGRLLHFLEHGAASGARGDAALCDTAGT